MEHIAFAFSFGIISSIGICLASCTPILIAYLVSTEKNPRKFIGWMAFFLFLRTVVFISITVFILLLGRLALDFIREYAQMLHIFGGLLIATAGVLIFFDIGTKLRFFRAKSQGFSFLAVLFGIKPCLPHLAIWGYVLVVAGRAMTDGLIAPGEAILKAAIIAISFSLGENIVPLIIGLLGGKTIRYFRGNAFRLVTKIGGAVLFILGIVFIFYELLAPGIARIFA